MRSRPRFRRQSISRWILTFPIKAPGKSAWWPRRPPRRFFCRAIRPGRIRPPAVGYPRLRLGYAAGRFAPSGRAQHRSLHHAPSRVKTSALVRSGRGGSGVCAQGRRPEHIAAQGETSPAQKQALRASLETWRAPPYTFRCRFQKTLPHKGGIVL